MSNVSRGRRVGEWIAASAIVIILAAAVVALLLHNRRMEREIISTAYVPRATKLSPEMALLQQYIRINTSNPPGNEAAGAQWLVAQLARRGVRAEVISSAPNRTNVYARIRGRSSGEGLLLLNHIDVVPATKRGWTKPPFSADVAANMVWGRGAADMKGIAICQLEAFLEVANAGRTPDHDLVFLAVADEEAGGAFGMRWLLDHRPELFDGIRYVMTEGGVTELQKEKLTYFGIEIGAKEVSELDLVAPTRDQLQKARIALEPYFEPRDAERVEPGVRSFFHSVAPLRVEFSSLLGDIDRTIADGKLWLLPNTYRDLLVNTVWAAGVQPRTGSGFAMHVVLSNLPGVDPDPQIASLRTLIAPTGASIGEVTRKEGPIPTSPVDTPLFALIAREANREYGPVTVGPEVLFASTSDARFLRPRGFVCYGVQPFPLDFFQTLGVHGYNERIRLDWFDAGVRFMRAVVRSYAFGPPSPATGFAR